MSDTHLPLHRSDKKSMNSKLLVVVIIFIALLVLGGFLLRRLTQKASSLVNQNVGEKIVSSGANLPADWPKDVPIYPNSKVLYSGTNTAQFSTGDTVQKVSDYYAKELAAQGWTIGSTQNVSGATIIGAIKDKRILNLMAATNQNTTIITLGINAEK